MNLQSLKRFVSLLKKFDAAQCTTPVEFLQDVTKRKFVSKDIMKWFITLTNNVQFFHVVFENFHKTYELSPRNKHLILAQMYFLIFELNDGNFGEVLALFKVLKYVTSFYLPYYLSSDYNVVNVAQVGATFFVDEYVIENIINPLLRNRALFLKLFRDLYESYKAGLYVHKTTQTKYVKEERKTDAKEAEVGKECEESDYRIFARAVPITTYCSDWKLERNLQEIKIANRERALELFTEAQATAFSCATYKKREVPEPAPRPRPSFYKPVPNFKPVSVKETTSTLMRDAARLCKANKEKLAKVTKIIEGGFDDDKLVQLEDEVRQERALSAFKEIERRHLLGLLSHEEAKTARQKHLETRRSETEDCKLLREELRQKVEETKAQYMDQSRLVVEKCKAIERGAKDAEEKLLEEKQRNAKLISYESGQLQQIAEAKQAEDLAQKRKIIEEIRALQSLGMSTVVKFDETETAHLGLTCEMSLAELKERLVLLKIEMKEELEERQRRILKEKARKRQLLASVKDFIEAARKEDVMIRKKMMQGRDIAATDKGSACFQEGPDELQVLRERLMKARNLNNQTA